MNKTNRKVHCRQKLRAIAILASKTSLNNAAITHKVQWSTARRACAITGILPYRRQSNALVKIRSLKLRAEGKTYAEIASRLGYTAPSVCNWCRDAGVANDRRRKAA